MSPSAKTFPYISFAMGWEVPLVCRNTISHGGAWILVDRIECATSGYMDRGELSGADVSR